MNEEDMDVDENQNQMNEEDMEVEMQFEGGRQSCSSIKLQENEKLIRVRLP